MENNQVESTINLQDLFNLLWKNILLIASVTLLLTVLVGLYTKFAIPEKFSSDTTLLITVKNNPDTINYNDLQTSQKLVNRYAYIAKSRSVLELVIENLNLDMTYGTLKNSVDVSAIQDTDIISIKVTLTDKDKAKEIADEIASVFMTEIKSVMNNVDTLSLIDEAVVSDAAVSPNLKLNVVIGFVLGAMISVGYVLLREFLDRTIKNEDDVEKYLHAPVLGIIPTLDKEYTK